MMATKPRPAEEESESTAAPAAAVAEKKPASSAEAIQDLERRLMGLGGDDEATAEDKKEEAPAPAAEAAPDLLSGETSKPAATAAAASGGGKGALLARIMAAQERAKAAQEKQQKLEASLAAHDRKDHLMKALEGKEEEPPPPIETVPPPIAAAGAPPAFGAVEGTLPPSFAAVEQNLPPSFGTAEKSVPPPLAAAAAPIATAAAPVAAPSAPSLDLHDSPKPTMPAAAAAEHNLLNEGIENILAPPAAAAAPPAESSTPAAPPSFEQIENHLDEQLMDMDEAFMLGEDGKPLSPEERKKMMEEQRAIMAAIQKESADNAAAIAAAQAEAFDQRSGSAVARVAGGGPPPREAERAALVGAEEAEGAADASERTVQIGAGQNVALHGQERTKRAIADGTAILVECMNCNNWMQVTESATLMFCPVCSVVSPVQKQSEVSTKEEAIQLTRDRQMAERLQAEINAELEGGSRPHRQGSSQSSSSSAQGGGGGFLGSLLGTEGSGAGPRPGAAGGASKSWWDTISEYVSVGVSQENQGPGHIAVSRPPGSFAASTDRSGAQSSPTARGAVERQGLLNASVDRSASAASPPRSGMQSARVAESKPLFSCIADSISSAATAMGETLTATTLSGDAEGNVHGVDSSSLLVTNAGRQQGGSYHQISDQER